jgi:mRNA-degrading endonuclease RelE of RelBE toxin-antitoxin system
MPAEFEVSVTPAFRRDLEALPASTQKRILTAVRKLGASPFGPAPKTKKLKGAGIGQWRLEIWPYRVRYDVAAGEVILYRVRHRKEIYRR